MRRPNPKIKSSRDRYRKKLGRIIRKARIDLGLTLDDLSERCDYAKSGLSYIENGTRVPSSHLLGRIAKALNLSTADLLT